MLCTANSGGTTTATQKRLCSSRHTVSRSPHGETTHAGKSISSTASWLVTLAKWKPPKDHRPPLRAHGAAGLGGVRPHTVPGQRGHKAGEAGALTVDFREMHSHVKTCFWGLSSFSKSNAIWYHASFYHLLWFQRLYHRRVHVRKQVESLEQANLPPDCPVSTLCWCRCFHTFSLVGCRGLRSAPLHHIFC